MQIKVFLSSSYAEEMLINRDLFRAELLARFNIISGQIGASTYFVDYEYGIPHNTSEDTVIRICASSVRESDLFFCILGRNYGHQIKIRHLPEDLCNLAVDFGYRSVSEKISILELEILTALSAHPERSIFFIQQLPERDQEMDRLLDFLREHSHNLYPFSGRHELTELALQKFSAHGCMASAVARESDLNHQRFFAKKLRYYIPQETIQKELDNYVESDSTQVLILEGVPSAGKTVAVADWVRKNQGREDLKVFSWFQEVDAGIFSTALLHLLEQSGRSTNQCFYQEDSIFLFHQVLKDHYPQKRVYLLDGLDDVGELDAVSWLITALNPSVKLILTKRVSTPGTFWSQDTRVLTLHPITHHALIHQIYLLEGKQLEYPNIRELLESICGAWSLRQVSAVIQHFLRVVKYVPAVSTAEFDQQRQAVQLYLQDLSGEAQLFQAQKRYLERLIPTERLERGIALLACSERGLSQDELRNLMCGEPDVLYHFYFLLDMDEDLYRWPLYTQQELLLEMNPVQKQDMREQLVEYFLCVDDDRAQIELCYQYVRLGWTTRLLRLLSSVRTWRIIESNSSLYFDELASALTPEDWDELIVGWKERLNCQPETYSEQDIFSVYTVLVDLRKLKDACEIMQLLVRRGGDFLSLASYHQNLATVYDDLDNACAVDHIDLALRYLHQSTTTLSVQNEIDTYLTAAYIYSHFGKMLPQWEGQHGRVERKIVRLIDHTIVLAESHFASNKILLSLNYHNIAYACWQMHWLDRGAVYIQKALNQNSPDIHSNANDWYIKAMIYLDLFRETGQSSLLEEAEQAIEQCNQIHEEILEKKPLACYRFQLVEVYNGWAQILNEKQAFSASIQMIDKAVKLESQNKDAVDYYLTCYHAGLFRMRAYDASPDPVLLKEGLRFARMAREEALRCQDSADAQDTLADIDLLIRELSARGSSHGLTEMSV